MIVLASGNVVFKIDISKAFDIVQWVYLDMVLRNFVFSQTWISLTLNLLLLNTQFLSTVIALVFFSSARNLKHGDPLSPLLFILS